MRVSGGFPRFPIQLSACHRKKKKKVTVTGAGWGGGQILTG